jgi:hypothetical protein
VLRKIKFLGNKFKIVGGIAGGLLLIELFIYFFRTSGTPSASPNVIGLLFFGLIVGALIMYLLLRVFNPSKQKVLKENSHTVVESMRKVFKIVFAEGQFNELYNYEETKKFFGFIPSTKRALVIIEAKVMMGYDFEKFVWELNEEKKKIKLVSFPPPELLSIESDYKYYNFDESIFNLLSREDLTKIQSNGKKQVELAAMKSHLPKIAADQMRTMLTEVVQSKNWQLENMDKINEVTENLLDAPK